MVVVMPNVLPEAGLQVVATLRSTMSLAEAVNVTTAPDGPVASVVMSEGTVTIGAVVSTTVTWKLALPVLPCASVAVQFTVVGVMPKVLPEAGLQVVATLPSTMSLAEAVNVTAAPAALVASVVMSDGTVTIGAVVSTTMTGELALPVLPCESVAEQVMMVSVRGKVLPEAGEQAVATVPSTIS